MTTTDTAATAANATTMTGTDHTTTTAGTDTAADEIAKWKALSRENEQRAKDNAQKAKDYDTLKASTMSDQERAVAEARTEARTEALREVGSKLAEASIRVAASNRMTPEQLDGLLEGIDASKFIDASGDPDTKAITAWVDKVAPLSDAGHRKPNVVPREGTANPKPGDDPVRALVRGLFKPGDD